MTSEVTSFKPSIIFIDDEFHVLKTIQRLCKKIDANFHYFNDAESALQWIETNHVDIAISDYNMPNHNGVELLTRVAKLFPESLRILTTGYAHENVLRDAINRANLWALIEKPWDNKKFIDTTTSAIEYHFNVRSRLNAQYKKLAEQVNQGQDSDRLKNEFLAMMSHEIRTPMTNVMGALNLLQETELDPKQLGFARHAVEAGNSMMALLSDILTYSKLESGFQSVSVQNIDIVESLQATIEQYRVRAIEKGLDFDFIVDVGNQNKIFTDIKIVRQVLSNLMDNAIKFTNAGSIKIMLGKDHDGVLRLTVKDTGIGIPDDKDSNIFTKFTQINYSYNREYEGTGLGLTICKLLVEKLAGKIGYQSELGKGSEFWFTFIDHKSAFDDSVAANQKERLQLQSPVEFYVPSDSELAALENKELLLVEDSQANQIIISSMLESTGIKITIANDGLEAIEAVKNHDFDLVLMDLSMPRMDGAEAARHIREKMHMVTLPIIALTANTEVYDIKHCLSSGMTDYALKPVDKSYLVNCIAYYLTKQKVSGNSTNDTDLKEHSLEDFINQDAVEQLIRDTSASMMKKITGLYFEEMRKRSATIRAHRDELTIIGKEAHAIKSSSATIGAAKSAELAKQLDLLCKQERFEEARPLVEELLTAMDTTEKLFTEHVETL